MKKLNIFMFFLIAVLVGAFSAYAAESSSQKSMSSQSHSFNASDLIGKSVKNKNGDSLGKVEDVIITNDGTASFVILQHGGALGAGAKYVPIPYKTFMSDTSNFAKIDTRDDLMVSFDKAKIDGAPSFTDKKVKELANQDTQNKICSHYGTECPHFM